MISNQGYGIRGPQGHVECDCDNINFLFQLADRSVRTDPVRSDNVRKGKVRKGQVKTVQVMTGQIGTDPVKSGHTFILACLHALIIAYLYGGMLT